MLTISHMIPFDTPIHIKNIDYKNVKKCFELYGYGWDGIRISYNCVVDINNKFYFCDFTKSTIITNLSIESMQWYEITKILFNTYCDVETRTISAINCIK